MTEDRTRLPDGWTARKYQDGSAAVYAPDGCRASFQFTLPEAISAAWAIVDKAAIDGQLINAREIRNSPEFLASVDKDYEALFGKAAQKKSGKP